MRRRTLDDPADRAALLARLNRLTPDAARRWGTMTAPEMLCHLADAFGTALGQRATTPMAVFGLRGAVPKWVALSLPVRWPHGVRGPREADPRREGTRPEDFDRDRDRVIRLCDRLVAEAADHATSHPMFGPMSRADWLRWGWLHLDHHLRQFGA